MTKKVINVEEMCSQNTYGVCVPEATFQNCMPLPVYK